MKKYKFKDKDIKIEKVKYREPKKPLSETQAILILFMQHPVKDK